MLAVLGEWSSIVEHRQCELVGDQWVGLPACVGRGGRAGLVAARARRRLLLTVGPC